MVAILNLIEMLDGALARLANLVRVDVVHTSGVVGKDDDPVVVDIGVAARDDDVLLVATVPLEGGDANDAVAEGDDLGRVARPDAELTGIGDKDEVVDGPVEHEPVGPHELAVELGHIVP